MTLHTYECPECGNEENFDFPLSESLPEFVECPTCMGHLGMNKVWHTPNIIVHGDPDHVPLGSRVTQATSHGHSPAAGERKERAYQDAINERRKLYAQEGQHGDMRHTHSVPAELYHGKIKETGDRNYWNDPANLNRHKSCKVD